MVKIMFIKCVSMRQAERLLEDLAPSCGFIPGRRRTSLALWANKAVFPKAMLIFSSSMKTLEYTCVFTGSFLLIVWHEQTATQKRKPAVRLPHCPPHKATH